MDFNELEAIEGLRWSWNSWPTSKSEAAALVIPLSIMCTPLAQCSELPILPYDPLICSHCGAVLNPFARVDYQTRIWVCPFCNWRNPFPKSYLGLNENNIPAELFPTYSAVEYHLGKKSMNLNQNPGFGSGSGYGNGLILSGSSPVSRIGSFSRSNSSLSGLDRVGPGYGPGPAFVFVVDLCTAEEELRVLKGELLHVITRLPDNALVGLVVFDSMVMVCDLGYSECFRMVLFQGEREISAEKVQ